MTFADLIELLSSQRAGSIVALLAATASAIASIFTTIRHSEAAELRKKQSTAKQVLATRSVIAWGNMLIIRALDDGKMPEMLIPAHQSAFARLEAAIDGAINVQRWIIAVDHRYGQACDELSFGIGEGCQLSRLRR